MPVALRRTACESAWRKRCRQVNLAAHHCRDADAAAGRGVCRWKIVEINEPQGVGQDGERRVDRPHSSRRIEELVGLGRQPHTGFLGRLDSSDREIVAEAMEAVGISHKAEKFVAELSDGERQKAMIARAVAQQTPVILLDEPTSFLDVASRVDVLQLLHRLAYNEGKAILLSSHDVSLSLSLSDRLWLLLPGGVIVDGQTEDLVLSGRLDELFLSRSVTFDMLTGEFVAVLPAGHRSVALRCSDPSLSHWATNALLRSGYAVGDGGKVEVSVVSATDISVGGRRCSSFAGMLGALEVES